MMGVATLNGAASPCEWATGAGCWGILCGPATGLAMAELIVDGEATTIDLRPFDPSRAM